MADSVVTKPMCAAVTRKRTDGDGDVVMDNPWVISLSDNFSSTGYQGKARVIK
jgi:hypothetical protein